MINLRFGLKTLGLCIAILGVLAFATISQAAGESFWLVNGAKISTTLNPTIEVETDVPKILLTEIGGKFLHVKCQGTKLVGAHLVEPGGKGLGKLVYHECDFLSLKTAGGELILQKACEPFVNLGGGVVHKGLIETNLTTASIVSSEGVGAIELKPTEGTLLTTLNLGPECAFGEKLKVGGALVLGDSSGQFSTNLVKHLFAYLKSSKIIINEGSKTATIDGSVWAFLGGAHKGLTWSGNL